MSIRFQNKIHPIIHHHSLSNHFLKTLHQSRRRVMATLLTTLNHYLVHHPLITNYSWNDQTTPGSSPLFLTLTVLTYLTLTLLLSTTHPPTVPPKILRPITAVHNLTLCSLSLIMAVGCTLSTLHQSINPTWPICFPPNQKPIGPTFFWAHVFYFSKFLEFIDTVLIVFSESRARRLSFLHVYHHAVVVVMCYVWLSTSQSLFPIALVTNASVHVVMYGYYFLSGIGVRVWWKRAVTDVQILQFVFSFCVSGVMLYYHFTNGTGGCEGIWGWCFNAVFNASLLALFVNFHTKNYAEKKKNQDKDKKTS